MKLANMHSADWAVKAVRNGWMPYYPQYTYKSNFDIVKDAEAAGHTTDDAMKRLYCCSIEEWRIKTCNCRTR